VAEVRKVYAAENVTISGVAAWNDGMLDSL
jgi:hypothetical protein